MKKLSGGYRANETAMRAAATENYPTHVLLEPCPRCGAKGGTFCIGRMYTGRPLTSPEPHDERAAVADLGRDA